MKFGVVVFPGSNCDRDMYDALSHDLGQEVSMLWHKDKDLSKFNTEDCIILPGGFSYGDYLRCGAIARFSPMMQSVIEFANSCWWCWWFGGTFGCRVLVDFYGLFAFPLAVVIEYCLSRHFMSRLTFTIFLAFIIFVNLFQTRQKLEGQIHWDSMTKDAYWQVFLKRRFPENYDSLLKTPDYEAAKNGKVVR